jgi:hypothetical protein
MTSLISVLWTIISLNERGEEQSLRKTPCFYLNRQEADCFPRTSGKIET